MRPQGWGLRGRAPREDGLLWSVFPLLAPPWGSEPPALLLWEHQSHPADAHTQMHTDLHMETQTCSHTERSLKADSQEGAPRLWDSQDAAANTSIVPSSPSYKTEACSAHTRETEPRDWPRSLSADGLAREADTVQLWGLVLPPRGHTRPQHSLSGRFQKQRRKSAGRVAQAGGGAQESVF